MRKNLPVTGFIVSIFLLGWMIRFFYYPYKLDDYVCCVGPWFRFIVDHHGFPALKYYFSDYTVPYLYLLIFLTRLPFPDLYLIKTLSCIFDFVLGSAVYGIVKTSTSRRIFPALAFAVTVFAPSILLNGAYFSQCDSIYAACTALSVLLMLKKKTLWATILFSIAISFKLQAIFLLPLILIVLTVRKKIHYAAIIPSTYMLFSVPAIIAGRPVAEILSIYKNQVNEYAAFTLKAPSMYAILPQNSWNFPFYCGSILFVAVLGLTLIFYFYKHPWLLKGKTIIKLAIFFAIANPFFLPKMHERYFYLADVFSIIYFFTEWRTFPVMIIILTVSFLCHAPFPNPVPLFVLAIAEYYALLFVSAELILHLRGQKTVEGKTENPK